MPNHTTTKETQISITFRKGFKKILPLNIVLFHFIEGSFIRLPIIMFYGTLGYF